MTTASSEVFWICHIVTNCYFLEDSIWLYFIKYSLIDLFEVDKVMSLELVAFI